MEIFVGNGSVSRVLINGKEMLCKAQDTGSLAPDLRRELARLQKIKKAYVSTPIQSPQLLGYVKHADNGHIIGLLREWIPGARLKDTLISTVPRTRREKWMAQIRKTVSQLHEFGVVWGDGKASNVIIGNDDDAWLIDFGGGWTGGWVDKEVAER